MQLQQKFASNIAVESEFFVHFFIRREMCNSPFFIFKDQFLKITLDMM